MEHIPVLLEESVEGLKIKEGAVVVDATLGTGGHSLKILEKVGKQGILIVFDWDQKAINDFKKRFKKTGDQVEKITDRIDKLRNIYLVRDNFIQLAEVLKIIGIERVDGILADLGWRIEQVLDKSYGMSFSAEGRLDMRLDRDSNKLSAYEMVNNWNSKDLEEVFSVCGEEREARRIALEIEKRRREKPIETPKELAMIVEEILGRNFKKGKIHPATKVFQALRIVANGELSNLEKLLVVGLKSLKSGGRLAVITFHSLEDRIVKRFFRTNAGGCVCPKDLPVCVCGKNARLKIVTKKPIVAGQLELGKNPRSRSAKLRIAEKI